jgi:hypothetical protein
VPGLAEPVQVSAARVEFNRDALSVRQMHAVCGNVEGFGQYRYQPVADRPHRFDLSVPAADVAEVERLLGPTLMRDSNFLARTLRWRASMPQWLRERRADGRIRIGTLYAGDTRLRAVNTRVLWTGSTVQLRDMEARTGDASILGAAVVNLRSVEPVYELEGRVRRISWKQGLLEFEGKAETSGTGLEALMRFRAEGKFQGRSLLLGTDSVPGPASGDFTLTLSRSGPQWKLTAVEVAVNGEKLVGEGETQPDGRVLVELTSPARTLSWRLDTAGERSNILARPTP